MKKVLSVFLAIAMCLLVAVPAFAANTTSDLKFGADGKFKIMQLNDTQDMILKDVAEVKLIEAAIAQEEPDLLVFNGDQLTDFFPGATEDGLKKCLSNLFDIIDSKDIPFILTFGNHDHDYEDFFTLEEQMAFYKQYENCIVPDNGCDPGTYNVPIMSSKGDKIAFNIYMMDTNNKRADSDLLTGYEGVRPNQVEWYKQTSDELKAANGGKVVPSLLFQHIPVKETYQFLDEVSFSEAGDDAVFSIDEFKWFKLNDKAIGGVLGEVPCSEPLESHTGQYQAWVEKGDIVGAWFGHDHVNSFYGVTDDGIMMGYNGGTGFSSYGRGGDRSVRIFEIDEKDPANYDTYEVTFNEKVLDIPFYFLDLFSPAIVTTLGKILKFIIPGFLWDQILGA
ncbi:MAG: metallophosphoesterase [Clostridia bacterium]|nr:metallophosphoesterase [Clostridia bacterium]